MPHSKCKFASSDITVMPPRVWFPVQMFSLRKFPSAKAMIYNDNPCSSCDNVFTKQKANQPGPAMKDGNHSPQMGHCAHCSQGLNRQEDHGVVTSPNVQGHAGKTLVPKNLQQGL